MFSEFLQMTQKLYAEKEAFAIAMVVRREVPSSGKPGDKAVIKANGELMGWVGSRHIQDVVIKESLLAIQDGKPRLVRISPSSTLKPVKGMIDYKTNDQSGGIVEVYIEPVLPQPHIIIMGKSHVAMALCKIAKAMDYAVSTIGKGVDPVMFPDADVLLETSELTDEMLKPHTFIVVCTQGEADELALENALRTSVPYVAFVASPRKAKGVFKYLQEAGIPFERLQQVKTPAGLDIHAKTPEEVAVSILAEIINVLRKEESGSP